jgi:GNAT superfamily N-acetyltransferase
MSLFIETTENPTEQDYLAILTPLRAYNVSQAGDAGAEKFALLIRDEVSNEVLGGLSGKLLYRWMFIELLAVPQEARGQGLGSRLMKMAEAMALEKNCVGIWLDTFDFQAPDFYRALGFSEFGKLSDYPPGHQRLFFQKRLDQAGNSGLST